MTESEWLYSDDLLAMLRLLGLPQRHLSEAQKISNRKQRLFCCAGCRHVFHLLKDERSCAAIDVAELYADGKTTNAKRHSAWDRAVSVGLDTGAFAFAAARCVDDDEHICLSIANVFNSVSKYVADTCVAAILRDLIGNPFKHLSLSDLGFDHPDNPQCIMAMAKAIYDDRSYADMPILADALEEAGCSNQDILQHCRGFERRACDRCQGDGKAHGADRPFEWSADVNYGKCVICKGTGIGSDWRPLRHPHVRGCHILDLLLDKT